MVLPAARADGVNLLLHVVAASEQAQPSHQAHVTSAKAVEDIMVFFRDRRTPFDDKATAMLRIIGDAFGAQLDRVIKTHHRHLPQPSPEPDEWDRLSDNDFSR